MRSLALHALRRLGAGGFQSGELLARDLGVSRSAISDALKDAERYGVRLCRIRGRGYRLETPVEFIDAAQVAGLLRECASRVRLEIVEETDSTNTLVARRAAAGEAGGLCVLAEYQHAGRGRLGRSWHSGLGGALTFSLLQRFECGASHLAGLSLAVAVAVLRGLAAGGIANAQVKWPNDVTVNFRKLAGILIETQGDMLGPSTAVIGIGLNYRLHDDVKDRIDQPVVDVDSIARGQVSRNVLFANVLRQLLLVLDMFAERGFTPFRDEWQAAHAYQGRAVRVARTGEAALDAVVEGVADDGALVVKAGTQTLRLASAEISLRAS